MSILYSLLEVLAKVWTISLGKEVAESVSLGGNRYSAAYALTDILPSAR